MTSFKKDQEAPAIEVAVDLVHLNAPQRLRMVGKKRWQDRRNFLKQLLGASAIISVPQVLAGCDSDSPSDCECQSDGEGGGGLCTCQADAASPGDTADTQSDSTDGDPVSECPNPFPQVDRVSINGAGPLPFVEMDDYLTRISVYFTEDMTPGERITESTNHFPHLTIDPEPLSETLTTIGNDSFVASFVQPGSLTSGAALAGNTTYTITVKGTATDVCGNPLDGNGDGTGGTDYVFTFTTGDEWVDTCPCQADFCACESNTCSCQSDSCPCQSFDCSCQFEGCPLYGL